MWHECVALYSKSKFQDYGKFALFNRHYPDTRMGAGISGVQRGVSYPSTLTYSCGSYYSSTDSRGANLKSEGAVNPSMPGKITMCIYG